MTAEITKLEFNLDSEKIWLLSTLKESIVEIQFTKVDGSIRVMNSTLCPELLPKIEPKPIVENSDPIEFKPRKESTTAFRVFDVEKQEFRSCRWDSIISIVVKV